MIKVSILALLLTASVLGASGVPKPLRDKNYRCGVKDSGSYPLKFTFGFDSIEIKDSENVQNNGKYSATSTWTPPLIIFKRDGANEVSTIISVSYNSMAGIDAFTIDKIEDGESEQTNYDCTLDRKK